MDMKDLIEQEIGHTIAGYSSSKTIQDSWREPLVGYANASDPLFSRLRLVAHPDHLLPSDLLDGARSVIFSDFSCAVCLGRCPCNALQKDGFDRRQCYQRLLDNEMALAMGKRADVCGKCSCGVPCSLENPVKRLKHHTGSGSKGWTQERLSSTVGTAHTFLSRQGEKKS